MDSYTSSRSILEPELYFLIARFLSTGPCQETSKVLLKELEKFKLLPRRTDWEGNDHFRSYENLVYLNRHIRSDHLLRIAERVGTLVDKEVKSLVPGVKSLLGAGSNSILRTAEDLEHTRWGPSHHAVTHHSAALFPPANLAPPSVPYVVQGYQMCGSVRQHSILPATTYSKFSMHGRKLGHLSAVYCVLFDRSGNYIFTGADDCLVKIWSTFDMRLLATLRGHSAEITDMTLSYENDFLASGSCDKTVRVWCLATKAPKAVLQTHSSMITSVQFCPKTQGDMRYLVSTGNDGCVCFWHYTMSKKEFSPKPIKFIERSRAGAQMLCSSFSPGGAFLATGNSDHVIRVYFLHAAGPEKICELEAHVDKVDSICYSNHTNRFISGSNDGTARIWRFERHEWRATVLNMAQKMGMASPPVKPASPPPGVPGTTKTDNLRVTMVSWSKDDVWVMTAASDLTIKVWNSYTGTLLRVLEGHEDEVYVLEACPTDARILLSAGHDGKMNIWDIETGTKIKKFFNLIEGQGHGAVFDCKFSPSGHTLAATDSHGHLLMLGFGTNDRCRKIPQQLFFHTDYRPLMRDSNNYVLDEQSQQPPHLMPPPFLVDIDGNPYPTVHQRLVPGRERSKESSLIPEMAVNAEGDNEVIGDRDGENGEESEESEEEEVNVEEVTPGSLAGSRPSIDFLIEELQRRQDEQRSGPTDDDPSGSGVGERPSEGASEGPLMSPGPSRPPRSPGASGAPQTNGGPRSPMPMGSPPTPRSSMQMRIGMRRSGEIEGVRLSSLGSVSVRSTRKERDAWRKKITVKPLEMTQLHLSASRRHAYSEDEVRMFLAQRRKHLLPMIATPQLGNKGRRGGPKKPRTRVEHSEELEEENVETARNRLTTRALYDTEEEEDEGGGSDVYQSERSSSDDYSDWVGDQGSANLEPPKRRSKRKVKRRRYSSSEEEVEVDDEETEVERSSREDNEDEEEAGPSRREERREGRRDGRPRRNIRKRSRRIEDSDDGEERSSEQPQKAKRAKPSVESVTIVTELTEAMRPPEWITTTIPRKAPFVPQMGDEVIYFRQGHEQYLQAVIRKEVYEVDLTQNQPWHKIPNLRAHESVKIVGIKWLLKPCRLCCLKLAFVDTETGKLTGHSFTIKYHDMADVIDFLVLKHHYDISVGRGWKPGSKFRSMIDDQWWLGVIKTQEPLSGDDPDSLFQCFTVHWDNGEFERLSPWDMEPPNPKRKPNEKGGGVDVTSEEYKQLLYVPKKTEWTSLGREAESARLVHCLELVMQHSLAEPFSAPVDLQQFPTYACIVPYPMDLSTVKARLENGFYRRVTALQWDVRLIHANAQIFNEPGSKIVKNANALTEAILRFVKDQECEDPLPLLTDCARQINGAKEESSERSGEEGKSKRKPQRLAKQAAQANPDAWLEQSESVLATLFDCEDSTPFRVPVDLEKYPDYEGVVAAPMDLTTVHTKLATGHYGNPVALSKDLRLMFSNSKLYNTNKRSRIYLMTLRLSALFEEQFRHIVSQWKTALKASGRVRKHPYRHMQRKSTRVSLSPDPPSPRDLSSPPDLGRPSTSGVTSTRMTNGHARGPPTVDNNDSDATIVEEPGGDHHAHEDSGAETEVYEEDSFVSGAGAQSKDPDETEDDSDLGTSRRPAEHRSKGKSSKRGKAKSSKPLPPRMASSRSKSIFYASDDNNNDDTDDNDADYGRPNTITKVVSRLSDSDDSAEEFADKGPLRRVKSLFRKSSSRSRSHLSKVKSPVKTKSRYSDDEIPSHRKARGVRSRRRQQGSDEDDEDDDNELNSEEEEIVRNGRKNVISRTSRAARLKKKNYADGGSDIEVPVKLKDKYHEDDDVEIDEDEVKEQSSKDEADSSTPPDSDSEDEIIEQSLHKSKDRFSNNNSKERRRIRKPVDSDDSDDSDSVVPRKRVRIQSPKKSSRHRSPDADDLRGSRRKGGGRKVDASVRTRNRGKQRVTYNEENSEEDGGVGIGRYVEEGEYEIDEEEEDLYSVRNVSSRGRVRKQTQRAKESN